MRGPVPRNGYLMVAETRHPARRMAWSLAPAAAVGVLAVLLTGCSGDAEADSPQPTVLDSAPSVEGTNDAAPTPENTESEQSAEASGEAEADDPEPVPASSEGPAQNWPVPEPPDEIYEPTEEGAEALIQHWFDVRHYARITGDTEPLEQFSVEGCAICGQQVERISEMFANNGWHVGDSDVVGDTYVRLESADQATGLLALRESEFETYWEGEFSSSTEEDIERAFGFAAVYEDGHWKWLESNYLGEYDPSSVDEWDDSAGELDGGAGPSADVLGYGDEIPELSPRPGSDLK